MIKQEFNILFDLPKGMKDVTDEYLMNATPYIGELVLDEVLKEDDIDVGTWIFKKFGGHIHILQEDGSIKWPDAYWNGVFWEFKKVSTISAIDTRLRKAGKQILSARYRTNISYKCSGIILDIADLQEKYDDKYIFNEVIKKFKRRCKGKMDLIVKSKDSLLFILRYRQKDKY